MALQSVVLALLLIVAVATDLRARRIPNLLVLAGLVAGLGLAVSGLTPVSPSDAMLGALTGLAMFLPVHMIRFVGAGDVKLAAAVGMLVGPGAMVWVTIYTFASGALLAVAFTVLSGRSAETCANLRAYFGGVALRLQGVEDAMVDLSRSTVARLPYSIAIATGTALALAHRNGWL